VTVPRIWCRIGFYLEPTGDRIERYLHFQLGRDKRMRARRSISNLGCDVARGFGTWSRSMPNATDASGTMEFHTHYINGLFRGRKRRYSRTSDSPLAPPLPGCRRAEEPTQPVISGISWCRSAAAASCSTTLAPQPPPAAAPAGTTGGSPHLRPSARPTRSHIFSSSPTRWSPPPGNPPVCRADLARRSATCAGAPVRHPVIAEASRATHGFLEQHPELDVSAHGLEKRLHRRSVRERANALPTIQGLSP
jgi:hypothetical protein